MTHTYLLRRKRSLEVVGHEEVGRTGTCSVKNMTCSQFPMKANCKVTPALNIFLLTYIAYVNMSFTTEKTISLQKLHHN